MKKLSLSKSNTAATLGGALVAVGSYVFGWHAPAEVVAAATTLVVAALSLVVKD